MDVDYPRTLLAVLVVVTAAAFVYAGSTSSAAFGAYNPGWEGGSALADQAEDVGADSTIIRNASRIETVPANGTVLVVLSPDEPYDTGDATRVRGFVRDGGTLIVAEDFGPHSNSLLDAVGAEARIYGQRLRDERHHFRSPNLPTARNVSSHPLVANVSQLTLNHGTAVQSGNATVLANTSSYAYLDANGNGELDDAESMDRYPVATVEAVGDGQVVVVGDPSLFINAMLDRSGNRAFVAAVFGSHERVLLDYSHAASLPPLATAVLAVRESALLQVVLGLAGLVVIGVWARNPSLSSRIARNLPDRRGRANTGPSLSADEVTESVVNANPEWDRARVRRVVKGIMSRNDEPEDNE